MFSKIMIHQGNDVPFTISVQHSPQYSSQWNKTKQKINIINNQQDQMASLANDMIANLEKSYKVYKNITRINK